jgi:glycine cleavage system H lipoate-binding protein
MSAILASVSGLAVFVLGMLARLGLLVAVVAALLVPVALVMGAARLYQLARPRLRGLRRAGRVLYRPGVRYAAGHTWVEREGGRLRIGLDGVAQAILPWALSVELPRRGARLVEGEVAAVISCGAFEARVAAPVTGTVVAVNAEVERAPALVKDDGYGRGWLLAIEPADARWSTLPAGPVAQVWLQAESERLDRFLEDRLGFAGAATRSGPAPKPMAPQDWRDLTAAFLHA